MDEKNKIIKVYKKELLDNIPTGSLIPVIINIKAGNKRDEDILKNWENHFTSPYMITLNTMTMMKTLWKERR